MSDGEQVIETKITCDFCRRTESLERFNGQSSFRVPPGWIQVKPQVLKHREDPEGLLKEIKQSEINEKVAELVPVLHLCTECIVDREVAEKRRQERVDKENQKQLAKEEKQRRKAESAVVEVTRVTSGRRLITEPNQEVNHGN